MESSAIAGLSALMGHEASTVCCIIANRYLREQDRLQGVNAKSDNKFIRQAQHTLKIIYMTGIEEIRSLVHLMSDTDPVVWEAVAKVTSMGREELRVMKMIIDTEFSDTENELLERILEDGEAEN